MNQVEQRDRILVSEMLRHSEILDAIARKGKVVFVSDSTSRYATEHAIELLAEAGKKTSQAFKDANPRVPWVRLQELRPAVAHPYDLGAEPVNLDQLWRFVTRDAPRITRRLRDARFAT